MNTIKEKIRTILNNNEIKCISDILNLQTEINIECSNFVRRLLDELNIDSSNNELVKRELVPQSIQLIRYDIPYTSEDPTPFDTETVIYIPEEELKEPILKLYYDGEFNYIVREKFYNQAIKIINNNPVTSEVVETLENFLEQVITRDNISEEEFKKLLTFLNIDNRENFEPILSENDFLTLQTGMNFENAITINEVDLPDFAKQEEKKELIIIDGKLQEIIPEEIEKLNNGIFICKEENSDQLIVMTEYNYKKTGCTLKIIEDATGGNLSEWTELHKDNLNKYPELRDKLVTDKLSYNEFLKLETLNLIKPLEKIEQEELKEEKPVFNLTEHQQIKFDGIIQKIDDILKLQKSLTRPPVPAYYMTVLEGAAGTGKTTMMKKVLEELVDKGLSIVFCSPTHQALGVIRETLKETDLPFTDINDEYMMEDKQIILKTLASFLGIKMNRDLESGTESFVPDPRAPQLCCDVLAIDESSMVSRDQLKIIIQKLHINVKCILFIGDEVQLDSPADNNESNGIFNLPQKFALEEVVRQAADNKILQFAWELRNYIKSKQCVIPPSQLLHPGRINENIMIINNQQEFLNDYFNNPSDDKLIATYTNKITNEYNQYVRQMKLIGQGGKPLDIIIDESNPERKFITTWEEYKEYFVGEQIVITEPNQRNNEVIHQTGERIIIKEIREKTHNIMVSISDTTDMFATPEYKEYIINYYEIYDEKHRLVNVIRKEDQELYQEILVNLSIEAKKNPSKKPWAKYWSFKEKFTKVNQTFAFTLHKLQGSTCENIYIDARDLDKFFKSMAIGVYKLIYIALTRPKQKVIFLI